MALKPDRTHIESYIDFFMNESTCIKSTTAAERGGIVCVSTLGSGIAMDQAEQLATYTAAPSGTTMLGMLMNDMVNLDLTRQHVNWHKDEVQKGGKITIWSKGWAVTNWVYPGHTPAAGSKAFLNHSGLVGTSDVIGGGLVVGSWLSSKDADGYAKLGFNLPATK